MSGVQGVSQLFTVSCFSDPLRGTDWTKDLAQPSPYDRVVHQLGERDVI